MGCLLFLYLKESWSALVDPGVFTVIILLAIGSYAALGAMTPLTTITSISSGSIPRLII